MEKLLSFDRKQVFWSRRFLHFLPDGMIVNNCLFIFLNCQRIFWWHFCLIFWVTHISTRSLNADREVCRLNRTSSPLYIHVRSHGFYNLAEQAANSRSLFLYFKVVFTLCNIATIFFSTRYVMSPENYFEFSRQKLTLNWLFFAPNSKLKIHFEYVFGGSCFQCHRAFSVAKHCMQQKIICQKRTF